MERRVRKVLIVANMQKDDAGRLVDSICSYLESRSIKRQLICFKGKPDIPPIEDDVDIAFSLGGDGTVLFSARMLAERRIPILAVNIGDFGFITEVSKDEWQSTFEEYLQGSVGVGERLMLRVFIRRNGGERIGPFFALNDAVIGAHNISKVVELGVQVSQTPIGRYRADGLLVSTPTGSTAYSMAAGGPILTPDMQAMVLNPICPFTLSNRPLVVPGSETITVEVEEQRSEIILTLDGQTVVPLLPMDSIQIGKAPEMALIVRSEKRNFLDVLRAKLKWAGGPDA
jgi:NAD+ kinase